MPFRQYRSEPYGDQTGAEHKERRLTTVRLNAASQNCGVFRSAEVHRILADVHTFDGITSLRKDVDKRLIVRQVDCFTHFFDGVFATLTSAQPLMI